MLHAVFWCDDTWNSEYFTWLEPVAQFLCTGRIVGGNIRVHCRDHKDIGEAPSLRQPSSESDQVVAGSLTAALMVMQFTRWLRHLPIQASLDLDLVTCQLTSKSS